MRYVLATSAMLALSACGGGASTGGNASGENAFTSGFNNGAKEKFGSSFIESCVPSMTKNAVPAATAKSLCECASKELVAKHSAVELLALTPEKAMPVMEACATRIAPGQIEMKKSG